MSPGVEWDQHETPETCPKPPFLPALLESPPPPHSKLTSFSSRQLLAPIICGSELHTEWFFRGLHDRDMELRAQ